MCKLNQKIEKEDTPNVQISRKDESSENGVKECRY